MSNVFCVSLGLLCSMQIPFVGFQPVKTSEHMASAGKNGISPSIKCSFYDPIFFKNCLGVFALLQAVAVLKYLQNFLTKSEFRTFFFLAATTAAGVVFVTVVGLTWLGIIAPWSGR